MNAATAIAAAHAITAEVAAVLVARTEAAVLREEIDAIKARILAADTYPSGYTGERITDPSKDWTIDDACVGVYHALVDAAVRAAGHDVPPDYCPALMAESRKRDAEHALIEAARAVPGLEHMTTSRLLCGNADTRGLELHAKYLDLLIGLAVNAPAHVAG
jgi:hypothetical protein